MKLNERTNDEIGVLLVEGAVSIVHIIEVAIVSKLFISCCLTTDLIITGIESSNSKVIAIDKHGKEGSDNEEPHLSPALFILVSV